MKSVRNFKKSKKMESNKMDFPQRAISYGLKSKIPSLAGRAILAPYQRGRLWIRTNKYAPHKEFVRTWRRAMRNFLGTGLAGPSCTRRHQENEIAGRAALLRQARLGGQAGAKLP